ncbi:MAG: hypothetical protein LBI14_11495, partial [Treponema sp.]|nr:hypothetical protein [Treponema sp.]
MVRLFLPIKVSPSGCFFSLVCFGGELQIYLPPAGYPLADCLFLLRISKVNAFVMNQQVSAGAGSGAEKTYWPRRTRPPKGGLLLLRTVKLSCAGTYQLLPVNA